MEARASAKYLRGSAQKARLVIDMIRGKKVGNALGILRFANKRAADGIEKCLLSAIANAKEAGEKANVIVDEDELWINACFVDRGPTKGRRRMRPAPQGRAYREQRHYCHVTVMVTSEPKETAGAKGDGEAKEKLTAKPARKRGGAAAAPRAKKAAPKADAVETADATPKKAATKKAATGDDAPKKAAKPRAKKTETETASDEAAESTTE